MAEVAMVDAAIVPFLAEWYSARAPADRIGETAQRINDRAASVSAAGRRVHLLMAIGVPADGYAFGVFAATCADDVAEVCDDVGVPPERISAAVGWWLGHEG